ncbi:MAG: lysylphosphatidylglycerol synthase transmembrane domain-containing protein [Gemmatimonadaceae bacterium]
MKLGWRGALGIGLSAAGLWWALHDVPWHDVAARLRDANVTLLILCSVAATSIFPVRAIRWRVILDPVAPKLPFGPLWRSVAIGMMVNNVVPARAGELARAYALTRECPEVSFSTSLASLVVDRLFDGASVLLLMAVAMLDPRFLGVSSIGGWSMRDAAILGIGFIVVGFASLFLFASYPRQAIAVYERFARRVAPAIEARGSAVLRSFAGGISVLRSPVRFLTVLFWAVLHWLLNAFAFWLAFRALHINAPFSAALFAQGIIVAFVSVPSTPGFAGVFELGGRIGLAAFGIAAGTAAAWSLTFHIVSYIPITLIGLWYLSRAGITYGEIRAAGERGDAPAGTA